MGYEIRQDESIEKATKRVLRKELERVSEHLSQTPALRSESIHEARKGLKKARAVVRLIREVVGEEVFQRENTEYRDIARSFSLVRDSQVMLETFQKLMETYRHQLSSDGFGKALTHIRKQSRENIRSVLENKGALKQAGFQLKRAVARVDRLSLHRDGWEAVEGGLRQGYRKARRSFYSAYLSPTDLAFHEARKSAKYLRHQMDLIRPCWPGPLRELSQELHQLSDLLGADHDLVMLREQIAKESESYGSRESVQALFALIERRQEELREIAEPLGRRLYLEKPRAFLARLQGYWDLWHRPVRRVAPFPHLLISA